jgi:type VI secretion system secreted protein VgrG
MPDSELLVTLKCSGGPLAFRSMAAFEEVSRLFEYQIVAVSEKPDVSAADVLNESATVSMQIADGKKRHFSGIVTSFGIDGVDGRLFRYRLVVRPRLWLTTRTSDIRIFQNQSVPDIVKSVLSDHGLTCTQRLTGSYSQREYCVQYRETDFNFVSRLLEDEGIFYFHEHGESDHTLVLADAGDKFVAMPGFGTVRFREAGSGSSELAGVTEWRMRHELESIRTQSADFNFETPSTAVVHATGESSGRPGVGSRYDAPAGVKDVDGASSVAERRLQEQASRFARFTGAGNDPTIGAGQRVTLELHPRTDQNVVYLVLQTRIDIELAGYETGQVDTRFLCRFLMQPASQPFRPARLTRKPVVAGPQTAIVVGNEGAGEVLTDKYGRVKVQFHWDQLGQKDSKSSCWLRVASGWAGTQWGMISLPRIGQEVVVGFLEGDPDRPLVVGRVYNAEQMPPYELPAKAHISTIKSRTIGGGAADFNELRFGDRAGSEYVLFHAQKDRYEFVENDIQRHVMHDAHETVDNDRYQYVKNHEHVKVGGDEKHVVVGKSSLKAQELRIEAQTSWGLKAGTELSAKAGTKTSIDTGTELHVKAGMNGALETGIALHLKGGVNVVVEAGLMLTLKAGPASVVLGPDGVSITGPLVKINSGGAPGSGNGASPQAPEAPDAPADATVPEDPDA